MNATIKNTPGLSPSLKFLGALLLFGFLSTASYGQNAKGDRPASSRENRFRSSPAKQKGKKVSPTKNWKRANAEGYSPRGKSRSAGKPGRALRPVFNVGKPKESQKAWKGDLTGRNVRTKNENSEKYKPKVYKQTGTHVRRRVPDKEGRRNVARGRPVKIPTATGKTKNVYSQRNPYVSNPSSQPRDNQRAVSNKATLARVKTLQTKNKGEKPGSPLRVQGKSRSTPYIRNKSINVWANFRRPKPKSAKAQTTDIAGRKIRGRNFETKRPGIVKAPNTYRGRRVSGKDRPYTGQSGYYKTATRPSRAWIGDLSGRKVRHGRMSKKVEGVPVLKDRPKSASQSGEKRVGTTPIAVKKPGYGASGLSYKGSRTKRRSRVNTSGIPVRARYRAGFGDQGEGFAGTYKSKRPIKGGGSVSGRVWNNNGSPLPPKMSKPDNLTNLPGNFRAKRAPKGGGSVSGRVWNNKGQPLAPRVDNQPRVTGYQGNIKAKRPEKGGGSVSGKLWNNNEKPLPPRVPATGREVGDYTGELRLRRFRKEYIQNKLAAKESLKKQRPEKEAYGTEGLQIKVKRRDYVRNKDLPQVAMLKQKQTETDADVKGLQVKVKRRDYVRNKNITEVAMLKLKPTETDRDVANLQVKVKRRDYVRNKNITEDAMLKLKPTETDRDVANLQVKVQRRAYVRNKNLPDGTMKKLRPTETDKAVSDIYGKVRQYHYVRNSSSDKESLKVREPGKAFAKATDYQGNIKMQKFKLFERNRELHPDARFVKTNKNNVKEERDAITNLKLWWARLFKKQENQPDHLKEKLKKPRYDKGEMGMWYE